MTELVPRACDTTNLHQASVLLITSVLIEYLGDNGAFSPRRLVNFFKKEAEIRRIIACPGLTFLKEELSLEVLEALDAVNLLHLTARGLLEEFTHLRESVLEYCEKGMERFNNQEDLLESYKNDHGFQQWDIEGTALLVLFFRLFSEDVLHHSFEQCGEAISRFRHSPYVRFAMFHGHDVTFFFEIILPDYHTSIKEMYSHVEKTRKLLEVALNNCVCRLYFS